MTQGTVDCDKNYSPIRVVSVIIAELAAPGADVGRLFLNKPQMYLLSDTTEDLGAAL